MKQIRIGDVPLEWFTSVGEVRLHDKLGNKLTSADVIGYTPPKKCKIPTKTVVLCKGKYALINKVLTEKDLRPGTKLVTYR